MPSLKEQLSALAEENGQLKAQIAAIKKQAIKLGFLCSGCTKDDMDTQPVICLICKHKDADWHEILCVECCSVNNYKNWQPPEAPDA